jgi:hypothetical protein
MRILNLQGRLTKNRDAFHASVVTECFIIARSLWSSTIRSRRKQLDPDATICRTALTKSMQQLEAFRRADETRGAKQNAR